MGRPKGLTNAKIEINKEIAYENRINDIIDSIEKYGFTIINENIELDNCTFQIEEIKDWKFNIILQDRIIQKDNEYPIEAIVWGMWIPGIKSFRQDEAFYKINFIIDKYEKENNNHFYQGPYEMRKLLLLILKKPWYVRYYSMSKDSKKYNYHRMSYYKIQCRQLLFIQNLWKIKDKITNVELNLKLLSWKHHKYINNYLITKTSGKDFIWNNLPNYKLEIDINNDKILKKINKYYNYCVIITLQEERNDLNV